MQGSDLDTLLESPAGEPQAMPEPARQEPAAEPVTGDKHESAVPPADAKPEAQPEEWTKQAVLDERRKRQDLEKKLKEYEARLQPAQQPPAQVQPETPPDWWSAPEQAAQALQTQFQQQVFETRVAMSERMMKQQHADYDDVSNLFAERAKSDPRLLQQLIAHPFPAEFAYQVGQQIKLLDEIGTDPAAYRAKVEAEIRAQLGQTQQPAPQGQKPIAQQVPRSLARDVSAQPRRSDGRFGALDAPASLDDLLG